MRIVIVGAGAMGSLFGGLLSLAGEDVVLVDVWREHVDAINRNGLRIHGIGGERVVRVRAATSHGEAGPADLLILFVKSYDTERAVRDSMPIITSRTTILTLQNGLGNVEKIGSIAGFEKVIAGVTMHGATLTKPGEVFHAGAGLTYIGEIGGGVSKRVEEIAGIFNRAGIETRVSSNILEMIWRKAIVNSAINAIGALTRLRNGELIAMPEIVEVMSQVVREGVEVAGRLGIRLSYEEMINSVLEVCRATANNKNSMLQDVERMRRTEIEAINGAIVKYGERLGVPTPVNRLLTILVRGLEKSYLKNP